MKLWSIEYKHFVVVVNYWSTQTIGCFELVQPNYGLKLKKDVNSKFYLKSGFEPTLKLDKGLIADHIDSMG